MAELGSSRVACVIEKAAKEDRYQCAEMTATATLEQYRAGDTVSVEELLPDYMRATEAEQKLKDGTLAKERAAKMARLMSGRKNG